MTKRKISILHTIKAILWSVIFVVIQMTIMFTAIMFYANKAGKTVEQLSASDLSDSIMYAVFIAEFLVAVSLYFNYKNKTVDTRIIQKKEYPIIFLIPYGLTLNFIYSAIVSLIPQKLVEQLNYTVSYDDFNSVNFVLTLLSVGICVPIAEEIFFRFFVFNSLSKAYNGMYACIGSALLFGLMHGNLIQAIYSFLIGFSLGREYYLSGAKLKVPIIIHCTVNCFTVILANVVSQKNIGMVQVLTVLLSWIIADIIYKKLNKRC